MRIHLLGFLLVLGAGAAGCGEREGPPSAGPGGSASAPGAGTLFRVPVRLALVEGGFAEAERGQLFVPLDRSDPDGPVVSIEFYRFPRQPLGTGDPPPVYRLNGGPGFPGLGLSLRKRGYYEERIRPFTTVADLVVVGQRGIGSSSPDTVCADRMDLPLDREVTSAEHDAVLHQAVAACRAYWAEAGVDVDGLNLLEAAADVRDLARALDHPRIVLWGTSFGSRWGLEVMRTSPLLVERAVLGSVVGPDHSFDLSADVLRGLERAARAAEEAPQLQGHIPEGGLLSALQAAVDRAEAAPVTVELDDGAVRFDGDVVRDLARGYTHPTTNRAGFRTWPADILSLHAGDFAPAARARLRDRDQLRHMPTASHLTLVCGSGISPERAARMDADPAVALLGQVARFYRVACPVWDTDLGDALRSGFTTAIPTVLVHGTWDTTTPYDNALSLLPTFDDGTLVAVVGGTHSALGEAMAHAPAFRRALQEFVRTGETAHLPESVVLPPLDWAPPPAPTGRAVLAGRAAPAR